MNTQAKSKGNLGSHPAVKFKHAPMVAGKLSSFNKIRPKILKDVATATVQELGGSSSLGVYLGEASYQERNRLRNERTNIFTYSRYRRDRKLWKKVRKNIIVPDADSLRLETLEMIAGHYAQEIGSHFSPRVYDFATRALPWVFNWLLNAASVKRFLPWGQTADLKSSLKIVGEVPAVQRLAQKGTILLVPTHQSNIDSVLIGYVIYLMGLPPFSYGAGLNLFTNPILSFFMSNLGAYTVDRKKFNHIYKVLLKNYSTRILREGIHSIFFPGGGRSRSGALESKLKLGLLGTGLTAQTENLRAGRPNASVFVVPMTTSYHFVLEASSLIEQYLANVGKHRFLGADTEPVFPVVNFFQFFWKLFSSRSPITVRLGRPMDIFGNLVDEAGKSVGPNGTTINPSRWLMTAGELRTEPQRDHQYTRVLGNRIVDRYYEDNTVLSSHVVAFVYIMMLRKRYPNLDLYRFLRLSVAQRKVSLEDFHLEADKFVARLRKMVDRSELFLGDEFQNSQTEEWVNFGFKQVGSLHDAAVLRNRGGTVWTDDMNLAYYYRNRLSGYGLSLFGEAGRAKTLRGEADEQGFLA